MTRQEALKLGFQRYGRGCAKHPRSFRRTLNGNCHQCIVERMRDTRAEKELSPIFGDGLTGQAAAVSG
jgi:hypothetical protein